MKKTFYSELAYVFGIIFLALGTALMERADFGMSMVVAPAYIIHLRLVRIWPFFSFGMAEYCLQFFLLILLVIVMRRFKKGYLFSFVTAVVYGFTLDFFMFAVRMTLSRGGLSQYAGTLAGRCCLYSAGIIICSLGVALLFKTYFSPEVYELAVREISALANRPIAIVKTTYDMTSLFVSVVLSFAFFGWMHFEGVRLGTLLTALINGWLIGKIQGVLDSRFVFRDLMDLRRFFD
jgi:uncharacterized membrane protein YczE